MLRPRALLAAALLVLTVGCTHAPWHPYRGWRAYKTTNVTVYADTVTEPSSTMQWMEEAYQALAGTFFQGFEVPPVEVIELDPAGDSPFVHDSGAKKLNVAVLAKGKPSLLLVGGKSERPAQQHILAHHFIEAAIPGAPLWFHEGFARYLSNFHGLEGQPEMVCFGPQRPGRVDVIVEPLPALFALGWKATNEGGAPAMNQTAWALVDFLLHGGRPKPVPDFRALMKALRTENAPGALATAYSPELVRDLDNQVRDHVRRTESFDLCPLRYPAARPLAPPRAPEVSNVPEEKMKAFFDALEALPDREGFADLFRPGA